MNNAIDNEPPTWLLENVWGLVILALPLAAAGIAGIWWSRNRLVRGNDADVGRSARPRVLLARRPRVHRTRTFVAPHVSITTF
jgi:hypothetical protein